MRYRILIFGFLLAMLVGLSIAQEVTETPEGESTEQHMATAGGEILNPVETAEAESGDTIPPEIASHADQWPLANRDYRNSRATFDSQINAHNVHQLDVAWTFAIPGRAAFGAAATVPLIIGNTVYFQDLESNVFAFDLQTGAVLWQTMYENGVVGPNGPAVGYGKVFIASSTDSYAALHIETGEEIWSVPLPDAEDVGPASSVQAYVYDGLVYMSSQTGGYTGGVSGHIFALHQETGEMAWEFQVIEEGFWGDEELNSGGGIWYPPAIDTQTGLMFWGTGNPAPFPGTFEFPNAGSREEPNLYANSIVALDHATGELVWYNYVNPNDLYDLDFQASPILAWIDLRGQQREIVIGAGKMGHVMAFDRQTGELIWDTPVGIHQNDDLAEMSANETLVVYPGILGGVETPMAYADGIVYVPVVNLPTTHSPTGYGAETASDALDAANSNTSAGQGTGEVVALNAATGQVLWSHEFPSEVFGGATVVNDLVFTATFDGTIYALDRFTGQTVWTYETEAGINSWPAVAGDTIIWSAGFGSNPSLIALRISGTEVTEASAEATETLEANVEATEAPEAEASAEGAEQTQESESGEFLSFDEANQTVNLSVIAAYDNGNGGLNFNGHFNGNATVNVPQGWTVNVTFDNRSNMPHSVLLVPEGSVSQTNLPAPVFEGATITDPEAGTTSSQEFSFNAAEEGVYALACGVPGHASQGQWIVFEVGSADSQPSYETNGSGS